MIAILPYDSSTNLRTIMQTKIATAILTCALENNMNQLRTMILSAAFNAGSILYCQHNVAFEELTRHLTLLLHQH